VLAAPDQGLQTLPFLGAKRHDILLDRNLSRRHRIEPPPIAVHRFEEAARCQ
jgi:hypothetical protein